MNSVNVNPFHVLVVEDDQSFLAMIEALLASDDRFVCAASVTRGHDVIKVIKSLVCLHLVLLDIGLSDMDGPTLIRQIKEIRPEVAVVILTVFDDDRSIFNALQEGASGYLLKAESENRIVPALVDAAQGGGAFTPSIASTVLTHFQKLTSADCPLTSTELNVLKMLKQGLTRRQIAKKTHRAYGTIDTHLKKIYKKLQVSSGIQAVIKAMDEGMI